MFSSPPVLVVFDPEAVGAAVLYPSPLDDAAGVGSIYVDIVLGTNLIVTMSSRRN
jgi:hypothetical protein